MVHSEQEPFLTKQHKPPSTKPSNQANTEQKITNPTNHQDTNTGQDPAHLHCLFPPELAVGGWTGET